MRFNSNDLEQQGPNTNRTKPWSRTLFIGRCCESREEKGNTTTKKNVHPFVCDASHQGFERYDADVRGHFFFYLQDGIGISLSCLSMFQDGGKEGKAGRGRDETLVHVLV